MGGTWVMGGWWVAMVDGWVVGGKVVGGRWGVWVVGEGWWVVGG